MPLGAGLLVFASAAACICVVWQHASRAYAQQARESLVNLGWAAPHLQKLSPTVADALNPAANNERMASLRRAALWGLLPAAVISVLTGCGLAWLHRRMVLAGLARRQSQQALSESEQRLKTILDNVLTGVLTVDAETHTILDVNPYASRIIGLPREQIVGSVCNRFVCPAEVGKCPVTDLGQTVDHSERSLIAAGGESIPILKTVVLATVGGRRVLVESFLDIRERKRAEKEQAELMERLRRAKDEADAINARLEQAIARANQMAVAAEAASVAKSEFLTNISHEIRTPLTAILGFTDLPLDPNTSEPERRETVNIIRRNGEHLLALVNDILDLSKIEAGKLEVEPTVCEPGRIARDVVELLMVRAWEKGLGLGIEVVGQIPERIISDPTRLRQALVNLVGNAIKFTEHGTVRVVLECDPDKQTMTFRVIDTGVGIDPKVIPRLFHPFSQADSSSTRRFSGTGLGLALTKGVAELLGGRVSVESQPGRGSTFSLTVPTGPLEGVRMTARAEPDPGFAERTDPGQLPTIDGRVLLVEDSPDNQRLIAHFLRTAGAQVRVVENGKLGLEAALEAWQQGRPFDVILMDMQMPVMDGSEATQRLRERGYPGQIIALTAHAMKGELERCLSVGCDHYLSKPISRQRLVGEVAARIRAGRQRSAAVKRP